MYKSSGAVSIPANGKSLIVNCEPFGWYVSNISVDLSRVSRVNLTSLSCGV